jgi:hypothetical protein
VIGHSQLRQFCIHLPWALGKYKLCDNKWYDDLPDASITSMDQLEETFLKKWNIKIEDIHMLIKRLEYMKQTENETVKEFHTRFENLLHQIPRSHHPEDRYLFTSIPMHS